MKKIIARELIFFYTYLIISFLIYIVVYIHYNQHNKKVNNNKAFLQNSINQNNSFLKNEFIEIEKIHQFRMNFEYKIYTSQFSNNNASKLFESWRLLLNNSEKKATIYYWNKYWDSEIHLFFKKNGFQNAYEVDKMISKNSNKRISYIKRNIFRFKIERRRLLDLKANENKNLYSTVERINFFKMIAIYIFGCMFILRYIFYSIKWALKNVS
jgi:hypothetical protein